MVFLAGLAAAFIKLGLGLFAVAPGTRRFHGDRRRRTAATCDEICRRLNCRRNVEVRRVASPHLSGNYRLAPPAGVIACLLASVDCRGAARRAGARDRARRPRRLLRGCLHNSAWRCTSIIRWCIGLPGGCVWNRNWPPMPWAAEAAGGRQAYLMTLARDGAQARRPSDRLGRSAVSPQPRRLSEENRDVAKSSAVPSRRHLARAAVCHHRDHRARSGCCLPGCAVRKTKRRSATSKAAAAPAATASDARRLQRKEKSTGAMCRRMRPSSASSAPPPCSAARNATACRVD